MTEVRGVKEFDDVAYLQRVVVHLYDILDDIDTADDMVKFDDKGYRSLVQKLQAKKNDSGVKSLDGYGLSISKVEFRTRDELLGLQVYESTATPEQRQQRLKFRDWQLEMIKEQVGWGVIADKVTVKCRCHRKVKVLYAHRCLYCGIYYCRDCAQEHFGYSMTEVRKDLHPEVIAMANAMQYKLEDE